MTSSLWEPASPSSIPDFPVLVSLWTEAQWAKLGQGVGLTWDSDQTG